jgi:hypothetical protein
LKNNVVDAAMMFGTGPDLAEALGAGKIILDLRKRGTRPVILQNLWGATLSWSGYGPYIDKNPEAVAAFAAANNETITWILESKNRSAVFAVIQRQMSLPSDVPEPEATLKRIVEINAAGLSSGISTGSIDGWNKYLVSYPV